MNFLLILTTATIKVHMFDLNKLLNIIVKMIKMEVKQANVIVKNNNINGTNSIICSEASRLCLVVPF